MTASAALVPQRQAPSVWDECFPLRVWHWPSRGSRSTVLLDECTPLRSWARCEGRPYLNLDPRPVLCHPAWGDFWWCR